MEPRYRIIKAKHDGRKTRHLKKDLNIYDVYYLCQVRIKALFGSRWVTFNGFASAYSWSLKAAEEACEVHAKFGFGPEIVAEFILNEKGCVKC